MPAKKVNTLEASVPSARRTSRRRTPSRKYLDSAFSDPVAPLSPGAPRHSRRTMRAKPTGESEEGQPVTRNRRRRRARRSMNPVSDADSDHVPSHEPRKRPRTRAGQKKKELLESLLSDSGASMASNAFMIRLWDDTAKKLRPEPVPLYDLSGVLESDHSLSVYVGQCNSQFPRNLLHTMLREEDCQAWSKDMSVAGIYRRVMIFNPATLAILRHCDSPTVQALEAFIKRITETESPKKRPRLYAGRRTSFFCLPIDVRKYVQRICHCHCSVPGDHSIADGYANDFSDDDTLTCSRDLDIPDAIDATINKLTIPDGLCFAYIDGDDSKATVESIPTFRHRDASSEEFFMLSPDEFSRRDSSMDETEFNHLKQVSDLTTGYTRRWALAESDSNSEDSIFDYICVSPPKSSSPTCNGFEQKEMIKRDELVCELRNHHVHRSMHTKTDPATERPRKPKNDKENESNQISTHVIDATAQAIAKLSKVPDIVLSRGRTRLPSRVGKGAFRTNPVGPDETPIESQPYSTSVYLWNYDDRKRSHVLFPLEEAVKLCQKSTKPFLGIYDGQDYDFERGPLSHTIHIFSYDLKRWANRGAARDRRVRIWNRSQRSFRAHQFCPMLPRLANWLRLNPDLAVFDPSMMNPTCAAQDALSDISSRSCVEVGATKSSLTFNRLCRRIQQTAVSKVHSESLHSVEFWNTTKKCKERRLPFSTKGELALFLLANPWIELYSCQDELLKMEESSGFYLTPIYTDCPAELASFWNKQESKKYIHPKNIPQFIDRTIHDCLQSDPSLELYLGQDTDHHRAITAAVQRAKRCGSFPYAHMLAYSGDHGHKFLSEGWAAVYVDVSNRNTGCAVFWDIKERSLRMQPDIASFSSIENYLRHHNRDVGLYVGQNLDSNVRQDVEGLLRILTFRPGYNGCSQKPMITRRAFLSSPNLLREEVGHRFSISNHSSEVSEKKVESYPRIPSDSRRTGARMRNLSCRNQEARIPNGEEAYTCFGAGFSSNRNISQKEPNLTCNDEGPQLGSDADSSFDENPGEGAELHATRSHESSITNDEDDQGHSLDSQFSGADQISKTARSKEVSSAMSWKTPLSKAKEKAHKISTTIREAGPKILNRQLKQDICQTLREELLLIVDSSTTLLALAHRARSPDFFLAAFRLCQRLEALDVYECFSSPTAHGYGPPDLTSIRSDLEIGRIHTIAGVVKRFRHICVDICQFNLDSVFSNEAIILQHDGEKRISEFYAENDGLVAEERKISTVLEICERAKKIGFQENRIRRSSRATSYLKSPLKAQPSIRVPGYQSQVTFYNYRDEKGYSVMGKRHSARVLGLSIDLRECEAQAGNVRPCHVCKRELFKSKGDSLQCSNRIFDICEESLCRSCLESIFSPSENEFADWRKNDNWICVHCRGLCVEQKSERNFRCCLLDGKKDLPQIDVSFQWDIYETKTSSISILVAKRRINGQFQSFQDGSTITLSQKDPTKVWQASATLPLGAYRCRVDVDGEWKYSTSFHVLRSSRHPSSTAKRPITISRAGQLEVSTGDVRVSRQKQIEWKMRKPEAEEGKPVHSFSKHGGGSFIGNCSRTEGYDWHRAKRHAVVHWIPEVSEQAAAGQDGNSAGGSRRISFQAASQLSSGCTDRPGYPRLKEGMSWREYEQKVHAFKFDHMRKETLWGVITGTSHIHGIGLFTQTGYQKGDFVIEYSGDLIRTPLGDIRERRYDAEGLGTYLFKIDEHKIVDATVKSNRARFTNHSCDPNMAAKIVNVRGRDLVVLLATRNIPPFAELTFNYQLPYEDKKIECLCKSWNCVGVMN